MSATDVTLRSSVPATTITQRDYIVLDGSSSMSDKWFDMQRAIDQYIDTLKSMGTKSHIRLSVFTTPQSQNLDLLVFDGPIDEWVPLSSDPIKLPAGMTPLYDAVHHAVHIAHDEDPRNAAFTFVTDGEENGSVIRLDQARAALDWARAKGFAVTWIGCDFNNSSIIAELGGQASEGVGVQKALLADAMSVLARKRHAYGVTGAPMHWSEDEQSQFGGYLTSR